MKKLRIEENDIQITAILKFVVKHDKIKKPDLITLKYLLLIKLDSVFLDR